MGKCSKNSVYKAHYLDSIYVIRSHLGQSSHFQLEKHKAQKQSLAQGHRVS